MSVTKVVNSIEALNELKNDKGFLEIVVRDSKKRYKTFYNVILNNSSDTIGPDIAQKAAALLSESKELKLKNMELLNSISNVGQIGLFLNVLNLCVTCVGFVIMNKKLDRIANQIEQQYNAVRRIYAQGQDMQSADTVNRIVSEYTNMLDCCRKGQPLLEDNMRKLVDREYEALSHLIDAYKKGLFDDQGMLVFSIFSLLSMFTVSLRMFDETYYYNNYKKLGDKEAWHLSHDKWMGIYETLSSAWFVERIQDFGCFDAELTTSEVDLYYTMLLDQVSDLREEVEDNQRLIMAIKDRELFEQYKKLSIREATDTIKEVFKEASSMIDDTVVEKAYQDAVQLAAIA